MLEWLGLNDASEFDPRRRPHKRDRLRTSTQRRQPLRSRPSPTLTQY
jgi:hypothetical protein